MKTAFLFLILSHVFGQSPSAQSNLSLEVKPFNYPMAPVAVLDQTHELEILKDGSINWSQDFVIEARDEIGREKLSQVTLTYDPRSEKLKVVKASHTTEGKIFVIPRNKIVDRLRENVAQSPSELREVLIPFEGLKNGSQVRYKIKKRLSALSFPGVFQKQFNFGLGRPELAGTIRIRSQIPLEFRKRDNSGVLAVEQKTNNGVHETLIKIVKPFMAATEEQIRDPAFKPSMVVDLPRVTVATRQSWGEFQKNVDRALEKFVKAPLPGGPLGFVRGLAPKLTPSQKLALIREWIVKNFKVSKNTLELDKELLPRNLTELVSVQAGNANDLALLFASMAKAAGVESRLVYVSIPSGNALADLLREPSDPEKAMPALSYFNHVVLQVHTQGELLYLDPTQQTAQAEHSDFHLHLKKAWVNSKDSRGIQVLALAKPSRSEIQATYSSVASGLQVSAKVQLRGPLAQYFQTLLVTPDSSRLALALATLVGFPQAEQIVVKKAPPLDLKSSQLDFEFEFSGKKSTREMASGGIEIQALPGLPMFYWNQSAIGRSMPPMDFPHELVKSTLIPGAFIANEIGTECLSMGPLAKYTRRLKNKKDHALLTEWLASNIDANNLKRQRETVSEQGEEIAGCFQVANFQVTQLNPKDSSQVSFEAQQSTAVSTAAASDDHGTREAGLRELRRVEFNLETNPNKEEEWVSRGRALQKLGMIHSDLYVPEYLQEAQTSFQKALALNPNSVRALAHLGLNEVKGNNTAAALSFFLKASKLNPRDYFVNELGGHIGVRSQNIERAVGYFKAAKAFAETDQQSVDSLWSLARALCLNPSTCAAAKPSLEEILKMTQDPRLIHNVATCYLQMNELRQDEHRDFDFVSLKPT